MCPLKQRPHDEDMPTTCDGGCLVVSPQPRNLEAFMIMVTLIKWLYIVIEVKLSVYIYTITSILVGNKTHVLIPSKLELAIYSCELSYPHYISLYIYIHMYIYIYLHNSLYPHIFRLP